MVQVEADEQLVQPVMRLEQVAQTFEFRAYPAWHTQEPLDRVVNRVLSQPVQTEEEEQFTQPYIRVEQLVQEPEEEV